MSAWPLITEKMTTSFSATQIKSLSPCPKSPPLPFGDLLVNTNSSDPQGGRPPGSNADTPKIRPQPVGWIKPKRQAPLPPRPLVLKKAAASGPSVPEFNKYSWKISRRWGGGLRLRSSQHPVFDLDGQPWPKLSPPMAKKKKKPVSLQLINIACTCIAEMKLFGKFYPLKSM